MKEIVWLLLVYFVTLGVAEWKVQHDVKRSFRCVIAIRSYSAYSAPPCLKPNEGYVYLNGEPAWEASWCGSKPNHRGVNTMIVDPFTCTASDHHRFDTWLNPRAGYDLREYLQRVEDGVLVVGVTGDEPTQYLGPALSTLKEAGVSVGDVRFRGNFAFVMQKGSPKSTRMVKALTNSVLYSTLEVITPIWVDE